MTDVEYTISRHGDDLPPRLLLAIAACHGLGRPELERTVEVAHRTVREIDGGTATYSVETPEALRGRIWNGRDWVKSESSNRGTA